MPTKISGDVMKAGADNFRYSPIQCIMKRNQGKKIKVVVYEPLLTDTEFYQSSDISDLAQFEKMSDVIIVNRVTDDIKDLESKVITGIFWSG